MTRDEKLAFHLEMVIWEDLPEGGDLGCVAPDDVQKQRAMHVLASARRCC